MCEDVSFSYFDHEMIVATRLHIVNGENVVGDLQRADNLRRAASNRKNNEAIPASSLLVVICLKGL
jgi:hypothetical protein